MKTLILAIFAGLAIPSLAFAQGMSTAIAGAPQTGMSVAVPQPAGQAIQQGAIPGAGTPAYVWPTLGVFPGETQPLVETAHDRAVTTIDEMRLYLNNGHVIELSGIWIPQDGGFEVGNQAVSAKQLLDTLFANPASRDVVLYQTQNAGTGRVNRLGHDLAHVVRKDGNVWVQGALIANGLAEAWPTPANSELAQKMYTLEDSARQAGKGLWAANSPYRMMQATESMDENVNRFAVVEGVIKNVSMLNNVTYLNFGDDWKTDFTIGISSTVRQAFLRERIDVSKLQGQRVRVRGWLRLYNGPFIDLETPVQMEIPDMPVAQNNNNIRRAAPQTTSLLQQAESAAANAAASAANSAMKGK